MKLGESAIAGGADVLNLLTRAEDATNDAALHGETRNSIARRLVESRIGPIVSPWQHSSTAGIRDRATVWLNHLLCERVDDKCSNSNECAT